MVFLHLYATLVRWKAPFFFSPFRILGDICHFFVFFPLSINPRIAISMGPLSIAPRPSFNCKTFLGIVYCHGTENGRFFEEGPVNFLCYWKPLKLMIFVEDFGYWEIITLFGTWLSGSSFLPGKKNIEFWRKNSIWKLNSGCPKIERKKFWSENFGTVQLFGNKILLPSFFLFFPLKWVFLSIFQWCSQWFSVSRGQALVAALMKRGPFH